jgi:hypothetical protein
VTIHAARQCRQEFCLIPIEADAETNSSSARQLYSLSSAGLTVSRSLIRENGPLNDVGHALRLCREHNLRGMEIVLKFEREELDVALSMGDAS